jgi:hypothetical protein
MNNDNKFSEEGERFAQSGDSHDLPAIANWFSENILRAELLKNTGSNSFQNLILREIANARNQNQEFILVSLGAGHGQIEDELLQKVPAYSPGPTHFYAIDLFAPNDTVEQVIKGDRYILTRTSQDLNQPLFPKNANMIIVHHALHHFLNLEEIFDLVYQILKTNSGTLIIADMIGRNGHMRWPESLHAIRRIWSALPIEKKYNNQFNETWLAFENWDCSSEGYEGIRSEDILKLLYRYFEDSGSFFWGGILDPFIDRGFGDNFDPSNSDDIETINNIFKIEKKLTEIGYLTATQVIGKFTPRRIPLVPSFTNFFSSKKYFRGLLTETQLQIDKIVDEFFKISKKEFTLAAFDNTYNNQSLLPYNSYGWDNSDSTSCWGIGLESKIQFSLNNEMLTAIQIECLIIASTKFGEVQTLINKDIFISQPLTPRMTIYLPAVPLQSIEITFTFSKVEKLKNTSDKRLITFRLTKLEFSKREV